MIYIMFYAKRYIPLYIYHLSFLGHCELVLKLFGLAHRMCGWGQNEGWLKKKLAVVKYLIKPKT